MAGAGRQMAGAASAHLGVAIAVLNDFRQRRIHVREPVRNVVHVVDLRARDRQRAAWRGVQLGRIVLGRRENFFGDRECPIRLVGRHRKRGRQSKKQDANEVFHEFPPSTIAGLRTEASRGILSPHHASKRKNADSFDHLVGDQEEIAADRQPERIGGLQVDHQLELGRLQHRQVGRFLALEDAADIVAELAR